MKGVSYITDDHNRKTAVVIDLNKHMDIWEDFYDYLIGVKRKNESKVSLDSVVKKLKKSGKLKSNV